MILKFRSNALNNSDISIEDIVPAQDWTWLDDVAKVQMVELITIPMEGESHADVPNVPLAYINCTEHFADCHWVGINPSLWNHHKPEWKRDMGKYQMCYVWKRNGKVDLLAIGFGCEIYLCNDEGKTIDSIQNPTY